MIDPSDEILMAHADGELDPADRALVDRMLASDAVLRARWERFHATGRTLAEQFRKPLDEPVPQHLRDLILRGKPLRAVEPPAVDVWSSVRAILAHASTHYAPTWRSAVAYGALLLAGACGGFLLHDSIGGAKPQATFRVETDGHILAQGILQRALETAPSNVRVEALPGHEPAATVLVRLSFKNRQQAFCRQYELKLAAASDALSGIGCRDRDGHWRIEVNVAHAARQPAGDKTVPAAGDGPLAAYVGRQIDGDALAGKDEAEAIRRHWQPH